MIACHSSSSSRDTYQECRHDLRAFSTRDGTSVNGWRSNSIVVLLNRSDFIAFTSFVLSLAVLSGIYVKISINQGSN